MVVAMMRASTLIVRVPPDPLEFVLLQNAQQLGLKRQGNFGDFVEEQRAAVGQLEAALALHRRAGEGAFFVAEEFALEEVFRHGGAVDLDIGLVLAQAFFVQRAGDDFLARAAFALDQHGGIGRGDLQDPFLHSIHLRADDEQGGKFRLVGELVLEIGVLLPQFPLLGDLRDGQLELAGGERLEQVIGRAHFHRLDGRFDRAEAGDDDDLDRRVRLLEVLEQFHAVAVGKLKVGDDEVGRLLVLLLVGLEAGADREHGNVHLLQGGDERASDDRVVLHHHDFFES